MRIKFYLFLTWIFFFIWNIIDFFDNSLGFYLMLVDLVLFIVLITLIIRFLYDLFQSIRERFKNRKRNVLFGSLVVVIGFTAWHPEGLIDLNSSINPDVLIAGRKGVASCTVTLKLKDNHRFQEKEICFGVQRSDGSYSYKNDTIRFEGLGLKACGSSFTFGVIKPETSDPWPGKFISALYLYKNLEDSNPQMLSITKNELGK